MSILTAQRSAALLSRPAVVRTALRAASPCAARTFFTIVEQGHESWRLSLGRNPTRLSPGLNLKIPVYHTTIDVDLRESSIQIPNLPGYTADNVPVTCSGSLFFRITDGYKACFAVSDVQNNIQNTGTSAIRSVLGNFTYDQVIAGRNELNNRLNAVIGNSIQSWGVVCTRFEVQSFQPANREVERQLELQMEAERNRRKQLLDTQAQVNVAEGQKQRVILESEGHVEAKANEADARYKTIFREAEARKQQALMEAQALSAQVHELSQSLSSNPSDVTPADRTLALQSLIELKRLEQLRAIAQSANNNTYFFGDKASLGKESEGMFGIDYAEHVKGSLSGRQGGNADTKRGEKGVMGSRVEGAL